MIRHRNSSSVTRPSGVLAPESQPWSRSTSRRQVRSASGSRSAVGCSPGSPPRARVARPLSSARVSSGAHEVPADLCRVARRLRPPTDSSARSPSPGARLDRGQVGLRVDRRVEESFTQGAPDDRAGSRVGDLRKQRGHACRRVGVERDLGPGVVPESGSTSPSGSTPLEATRSRCLPRPRRAGRSVAPSASYAVTVNAWGR